MTPSTRLSEIMASIAESIAEVPHADMAALAVAQELGVLAEGNPQFTSEADAVAYRFVRELIATHFVTERTFDVAWEAFGPEGLVGLVAAAGWVVAGVCAARAFGAEPSMQRLLVPAGDLTPAVPPDRSRGRRAGGPRFDVGAPLTPLQSAAADLAPGRELRGPFRVWITTPDLFPGIEALGTYCQHDTLLPERLRELAIMVSARRWDAQHSWIAHRSKARTAGLDESFLVALAAGAEPQFRDDDDRLLFAFVDAVARAQRPTPAVAAGVRGILSEPELADLVASIGVYVMNALILNAFELELPPGATPPYPDVHGFRKESAISLPTSDLQEHAWTP